MEPHIHSSFENTVAASESVRVAELLKPAQLPEAGFQSYERLASNAQALKADFIAGKMDNPPLEYQYFQDLSGMDKGIIRLYEALEEVRASVSEEKAADIAPSLEFRAAEMEYVKLLSRLNFVVEEGADQEVVRELAEEARTLGHELYGEPDPELRDAVYARVWDVIDSKNLSASVQEVYDELRDGGAGRGVGLPRPEGSASRLPGFEDPSLHWAGEIVLEENDDIEALVREFWSQKVEAHGEDFVATPQDMVEAFEAVLQHMDPEGVSGVQIILQPGSANLSWETPLMAVVVGEDRPPIKSSDMLFRRILHELKVHGGRAIRGLQTDLPVLGTGLYTESTRPDYLTFEEGFATAVEGAVSDKKQSWDVTRIGHYVNISLAEAGADFRSVFETAWRYRLLMKIGDGQDVTDEMVASAKSMAFNGCVRIFRGTPTAIQEGYPDIQPLSFNKDLAYVAGRVLAMDHIKQLYDSGDKEGLLRLFEAKYDPTIPEQAEIVDKYFS